MNQETNFRDGLKGFKMLVALWIIVALSLWVSEWFVLLIIPYLVMFFGKKAFPEIVSSLVFLSAVVFFLTKPIFENNLLSTKHILFSVISIPALVALFSLYYALFQITRWAIKTLTLDFLKRLPPNGYDIAAKFIEYSFGVIAFASLLLFLYSPTTGKEYWLYYVAGATATLGIAVGLKDAEGKF